MVYQWDDKEAECYRLYVEEKKSLDEVMSYWEAQGFTPSKRAFQTQFKRWDFPRKQDPAHKNPALVARLQELWEQNYAQKDMVDTLQAEGFSINDRELIRLRLRLKLLLRESVPRPKRKLATDDGARKVKAKKKRAKVVAGHGLINQLTNAILAEESSSEEESEAEREDVFEPTQEADTPEPTATSSAVPTALSAEELLRKQLRQEQLQIESDEKWRTRKRRRRTRGWAGLPADAPGEPPRFPSETTIDEAKAYLGLNNDMYREVRERFLDICRENAVVKKTTAGPEKWAQIVQQLIRENVHLSSAFEQEPEVLQSNEALFRPKGQRALSLDVICMDVTKRLRVMEKSMSLPEAKNLLCLNPERTRYVRAAFAAKLIANNFTNKFEAGDELWTELRQAWVNESEYLTKALAQGEADPDYNRKLRAVEVLARDVMKRQQQERIAKDPTKKKQIHQGPGPGPAPPALTVTALTAQPRSRATQANTTTDTPQSSYTTIPTPPTPSDLQIDPSLLLAASDAAFLPTTTYDTSPYEYHTHTHHPQTRIQQNTPPRPTPTSHYQHYYPAPSSTQSISTTTTTTTNTNTTTLPMPLPIYFRLHPHSTTPQPSKTVWLSILHSASLTELGNLAMREHRGTVVHKIEGVVTYRGGGGEENREVVVEVGDDEELGAYLALVRGQGGQGQGGKAVFVVLVGERGMDG
ncbi:hypothetical protein T440DRAFT_505873 [Plenodomus tracheiphilus IPT5]|uniref:Uncharacterized protein n=1 Tax=Plenodomus tracheiphilus IPT5 TaxID=1408161 RepID=A0A6A7BFV7_9PLEO|nr:hypothetical protein T440DRAFT_505873 [Plenodomus tracheiphilus IPT5]